MDLEQLCLRLVERQFQRCCWCGSRSSFHAAFATIRRARNKQQKVYACAVFKRAKHITCQPCGSTQGKLGRNRLGDGERTPERAPGRSEWIHGHGGTHTVAVDELLAAVVFVFFVLPCCLVAPGCVSVKIVRPATTEQLTPPKNDHVESCGGGERTANVSLYNYRSFFGLLTMHQSPSETRIECFFGWFSGWRG